MKLEMKKATSFFRYILKKIREEFFGGKEVFYINGSEELPPPLNSEKERECIRNMEEGIRVEENRNLLIEHNLRLVVYIAKKFENTGVGMEDLVSIGTIGLIKGITSFRSDKNIKLATYSSKCIENEILMFLRKLSTRRQEISIDEPLNVDWDGNELLLGDVLGTDGQEISRELEREEDMRQLFSALMTLPPRDREIIISRFGLMGQKELTQKEVAEKMGISQSYISRLEKKIILRLKKQLLSYL